MSWPEPRPGLVIRFSYLWKREAEVGREDGVKDRPCAIVLAVEDQPGRKRVIVLPITHSAPALLDEGVELPRETKRRLGLDSERSWVIMSEAKEFAWPGSDLRFLPGQGPESAAYGYLPPLVFRAVRERFLTRVRANRLGLVRRSE